MLPALGVALASVVLGGIATVIGQVTGGGAEEAVPWIQGGATLSAVGALVFMARKLTNGELVALRIDELLKAMHTIVERSDKRDEEVVELLRQAGSRETTLRDLLTENTRAVGANTQVLGQIVAHLSSER